MPLFKVTFPDAKMDQVKNSGVVNNFFPKYEFSLLRAGRDRCHGEGRPQDPGDHHEGAGGDDQGASLKGNQGVSER